MRERADRIVLALASANGLFTNGTDVTSHFSQPSGFQNLQTTAKTVATD